MKNKGFFETAATLLAALVLLGGFSVTAYADGGDYYDYEDEYSEEVTGGIEPQPLTPDGNLSLIDDIEGEAAEDKQFIIVQSKNGNYFYIIVDRAAEGKNTVHFLNQVDEADLMALMEDGQTEEKPATCICAEKCQAGAVNTACPVCAVNMSECAGKAPEVEPEPEPAPEKEFGSSGALVLILLLAALGVGGAFAYIKFIKPKQGAKVSADPDDYEFEDEEYENEDVPESEDIK